MDDLFTNPKKLAEMMGTVPHFQKMPLHDLLDIVRAGSIVRKYHEDVIFREFEPCAGLYVLLKGQVHLYKNGPEGQEYILSVLSPVTMFNEVAVLDEGDNPGTAIAQGDCLLWKVRCQDFRDLLQKYPQVSFGLLPILARRNRWLISQYEDLCFLTVRARTAKLLLEFSHNGELEIDRRELRIQEIAARIFTSAEVVSRTISLLATRGMIDSDRQSIVVRDAGALAKLAYLDPDFEN
jgi:CRP/FNR family transcriptional regulator